jgi:hypothetical protein
LVVRIVKILSIANAIDLLKENFFKSIGKNSKQFENNPNQADYTSILASIGNLFSSPTYFSCRSSFFKAAIACNLTVASGSLASSFREEIPKLPPNSPIATEIAFLTSV